MNPKENRSERLFIRIKPSVKKKLMEMAKKQNKSIADIIQDTFDPPYHERIEDG